CAAGGSSGKFPGGARDGSAGGDGPSSSDDAAPAPADRPPVDAFSPDFGRPGGDPALLAIAGDLHGAFLELECDGEEIEFQFCVPKNMGVEDLMLRFGGEAGKRYAVVLEVWGVVEGIRYSGGKKLGEHF